MALILLVRHGDNDWVKEKRLAGWTPGVHLNERGRQQAEALAERLGHLPVAAIYSSPLERCLETAAPLAQRRQLEVQPLPAVGEVQYGAWQGEKLRDLVKKKEWAAILHHPSRFRFPQGDSFRDVQARALNALDELAGRHQNDVVVVVSHADVIKIILAHYLGLHLDQFQRLSISPAAVSVVALGEQGPARVLRINDDGPIQMPERPAKRRGRRAKASANGAAPELTADRRRQAGDRRPETEDRESSIINRKS